MPAYVPKKRISLHCILIRSRCTYLHCDANVLMHHGHAAYGAHPLVQWCRRKPRHTCQRCRPPLCGQAYGCAIFVLSSYCMQAGSCFDDKAVIRDRTLAAPPLTAFLARFIMALPPPGRAAAMPGDGATAAAGRFRIRICSAVRQPSQTVHSEGVHMAIWSSAQDGPLAGRLAWPRSASLPSRGHRCYHFMRLRSQGSQRRCSARQSA